jgi:ribosome-associated protein
MNTDDNTSPILPSKSQLKREMTALQKLGEKLVNLKPRQLHDIPLPEHLLLAIEAAQKISSHGAKRRQLQYIGKLMRSIDPEPIQTALDKLYSGQQHETHEFHDLEEWRTRLLTGDDAVINDFLEIYPNTDRQQLRQLLRNARKENEVNKPHGALKALFRYLREVQLGSK